MAQGIKRLDDGRHADGDGLFFFVRGNSQIWVYRFQLNGKRQDIQLSKYPTMLLKGARNDQLAAAQLRDRVLAQSRPKRRWLERP
jgi:hypothetical protein